MSKRKGVNNFVKCCRIIWKYVYNISIRAFLKGGDMANERVITVNNMFIRSSSIIYIGGTDSMDGVRVSVKTSYSYYSTDICYGTFS